MAKKVIVGGRIESKEVGGIVTGAAEILDDSKGKKQNVINQETDAELLRLDESKQNNLTFDNAPTEGSDNPVKSGGLYTAQQAILLAIAAINELIPSAASVLNQLADKAFVNSSISTNTATFRGTSAAGLTEQQFLAWANGLEHDLNDYVFWQTSDAAGNTLFKRYKWNGTEWAYEYTLNNSTFTAEQWEAIQSGITALLVTKLRALPTAQELIQSFDGKQDVLTFDDVPTLGSTNPVKSSGIFNAIKNVSDVLATFINETEALIPAEATAQNQLADKADVAAKILAAIPSWKGQYDALTDLQAVTGAKAGDMGCVKTTDSDGHTLLTFYQYSAQGAWVEYYTLRHYAQNKPATTGTTGDYPYNGMGRIELQKNIVNGVNTLTQAMLNQQNTIYVINYDFTLGDDITVPANCVLEFDGGSISGAQTLTGTNTGISAGLVKIFNTIVTLAGTWNVSEAYPEWLGATNDINTDSYNAIQKCIDAFDIAVLSAMYKSNNTISLKMGDKIIGKSTYTVGVKFDDSVNIGITQKSSSTLRACVLKDFQIHKDTKTSNSSGILFSSASEISIENVSVVRFTYGFDLNSFYICTISRCDFAACDYGIYFGRNDGNSTSCTIDSCYAMWCDVGYELKKLVYSTLNSCACDGCRVAYDFWHSVVNLDGCGCETISERVLCLEAHNDSNYNGNRVKVNNFIIINCTSTVSPIKIAGNTRWAIDRNTVELNLISVSYNDSVTKSQYLIEYGGDTQLYLNNIVGLTNQELFNTNYDDIRAQNIYVNGIRKMILPRLKDEHTVISGVGDRALVYANDSSGEYWIMAVWNGTQWKDERGFTPNSHKGLTVHRPHGKADTSAGSLAVLETTDIGFDWFDINLNKPVYATSINATTGAVTWVDATGATV